MQANFIMSLKAEVDPEKLKQKLGTEGMAADEAKKVLRRAVFRYMDEQYTEGGGLGEYTREVNEDINDAIVELGLAFDSEDQGDE